MSKRLLKEGLGWGFVLWLIGYMLGIVLFMVAPRAMIGWMIMPVGVVITWWVLMKKVKEETLADYVKIALIWTLTAMALDYFLLVKVFKPADGYYKLDVYIYYALTFALPIIAGWRKK